MTAGSTWGFEPGRVPVPAWGVSCPVSPPHGLVPARLMSGRKREIERVQALLRGAVGKWTRVIEIMNYFNNISVLMIYMIWFAVNNIA